MNDDAEEYLAETTGLKRNNCWSCESYQQSISTCFNEKSPYYKKIIKRDNVDMTSCDEHKIRKCNKSILSIVNHLNRDRK